MTLETLSRLREKTAAFAAALGRFRCMGRMRAPRFVRRRPRTFFSPRPRWKRDFLVPIQDGDGLSARRLRDDISQTLQIARRISASISGLESGKLESRPQASYSSKNAPPKLRHFGELFDGFNQILAGRPVEGYPCRMAWRFNGQGNGMRGRAASAGQSGPRSCVYGRREPRRRSWRRRPQVCSFRPAVGSPEGNAT